MNNKLLLLILLSTLFNSFVFTQESETANRFYECTSLIHEYNYQDLPKKSSEIKDLLRRYKNCDYQLKSFNDSIKTNYFIHLAELYYQDSQYKESLHYSSMAYDRDNLSHLDSVRLIKNNLTIYKKMGLKNEYLQAAKLLNHIATPDDVSNFWEFGFYKSKIYQSLQLWDLAVKNWYEDRADLHQIPDENKLIITQYNTLGFYFLELDELDSAMQKFRYSKFLTQKSDDFIDQSEKDYFSGVVDGNIAQIKHREGDLDSAIYYVKKNIESSGYSKDLNNTFGAYNFFAFLLIEQNELDSAKVVLDKVTRLKDSKISNENLIFYLKSLSKFYEKSNQPLKSNQVLKELMAVKDSIHIVNNKATLAGKEVEFEVEVKNQKIKELELEKSLNKQDRKRSFVVNSLALILLAGLTFFYFVNNQKNRLLKKNFAQIESQNETINKAYKRNAFLLKELNHRVKNNLQVISGILSIEEKLTDKEDVRQITRKTRNRINSISLVHQQFVEREVEQTIDLKSYFEMIIRNVLDSFGVLHEVELDMNVKVMKIPSETISPLGLILNEIATNSCKYAFSITENPKLTLNFVTQGNINYFEYKDNGPGISDDVRPNSIGMELVKGLSRQIDGTLSVENDNGFKCVIEIKND